MNNTDKPKEPQLKTPLHGALEMAALGFSVFPLKAGTKDGHLSKSWKASATNDVSRVNELAKRYPGCEWIVSNADREVPYSAGTFSLVMSITARMNADEFRRVLRDGGRLLVAIPAPDDLIELRGEGRDRVARTIETFAQGFTLAGQRRATTTSDLEAAAVEDVLHSIYRPMRSQPAAAMRVTFSLDLLLFRAY